MKLLSVLRAALIASGLGLLGVLVYSLTNLIDHSAEAAYARDLRLLGAVDTRLNEDLLRSRSGLSAHYDALGADTVELWRLHRAASVVPRSLRPAQAAAFLQTLGTAEELLEHKDVLVERFKTQHAILRNSRHFMPVLASRLQSAIAGQPAAWPLHTAISRLMAALLTLDLQPRAAHAPLSAELLALESSRGIAQHVGVEQDLSLLLSHARLIGEREQTVDRLVREILDVPFSARTTQLSEVYSDHYRAALDRAALRMRLLTVLVIVSIILGLTEVILRLQNGAQALRKATSELKSANLALGRERERERELGELKTRFVSMTSHELKTPLSTILSSSEMLEAYAQRWEPERIKSHLGRIVGAARGMKDMLEEILLIGRAEAGALQPAPIQLDLEGFCRELVEARRRVAEGSHPIRTNYCGRSEVCIDERLLSHILSNLLDNALKYSDTGSEVTLDVEVTDVECRFVVRDLGIGIPPGEQAFLFDSFYRATNVGQIAGSGLGLAVVKRAVEVQNGSIRIESEPNKGSEFRISLPCRVGPETARGAHPRAISPVVGVSGV